jgi:hypothetical protein
MLNLIERYRGGEDRPPPRRGGENGRRQALHMLRRVSGRGAREAEMVATVLRQAARKPAILPTVMHFLGRYEQARFMLDHAGAAV